MIAAVLLLVASAAYSQQPNVAAAHSRPPSATTLRFAAVGDTGTGNPEQHAVASQMLAEYERSPFAFVLMLGDNVYGGKFDRIGSVFEAPYRGLLDRGVRFYATLGNHDIRCEAEQLAYPAFGMNGRRAYSFAPADGLVEFFTIDTTSLLEGRHKDQLEWLDRALQASRARWKIAFFHHPPYSPGRRHGDNDYLIALVLPILKRGNVQLVMTGHEHFFAKIRPQQGIHFLISGSGGKIHKGGIVQGHPYLEAGNDRVNQFLSFTLTWDALEYAAIASTGAVLFRQTLPYPDTVEQ